MSTYKEIGYSSTLTKGADASSSGSSGYMFAADSALMIGGLGAGQLTGGDLNGDINVSSGSISIKNESGKEMISINSGGIFIKDEISDNNMLTIDKNGFTLSDGKNKRMRIGVIG